MKHENLCILFDTHHTNEFVKDNFDRVRRAAEGICEVVFCHDARLALPPVSGPSISLTRDEIFKAFAHGKGDQVVPGNPDLKIIAAAKKLPRHDRFIRIEYDVLPLGDARRSFETLAEAVAGADLSASHFASYAGRAGWMHWRSLVLPDESGLSFESLEPQLRRAFFPLSSFSRAFLEKYEEYLRNGWSGHYEMLMPTVANLEGVSIVDLSSPGLQLTNKKSFSTRIAQVDEVAGMSFAHKVKSSALARALLEADRQHSETPTGEGHFARGADAIRPPEVFDPAGEPLDQARSAAPAMVGEESIAQTEEVLSAAETNAPAAAGLDSASEPDPADMVIWTTQGVRFWTLLGAILVKARPNSILELGSGRSTTFLADYAFRARIRSVSIEQSEIWYRKVTNDLRFMSVSGKYVYHVPVSRDAEGQTWYDIDTMKQLLRGRAFDMVFVDGPEGKARRSVNGQAVVRRAARNARLIIVDDVHRPYNRSFFNKLAARFPEDGRFFYRYNSNCVGIAAGEWRGLVRSCFDFLGMAHTPTFPDESAKQPATVDEQSDG